MPEQVKRRRISGMEPDLLILSIKESRSNKRNTAIESWKVKGNVMNATARNIKM
jgi:hypothetical protein